MYTRDEMAAPVLRIEGIPKPISKIGLGSAQFSGGGLSSYPALPQPQVDAIIQAALDGGINWFDTAELYGRGRSERDLSAGLSHAGIKPGDVTVATKWCHQVVADRPDCAQRRTHDR